MNVDHIRNKQIAEHIRTERLAGNTYQAAIASAAEEFSVEDRAKTIWGKYRSGPYIFSKIGHRQCTIALGETEDFETRFISRIAFEGSH